MRPARLKPFADAERMKEVPNSQKKSLPRWRAVLEAKVRCSPFVAASGENRRFRGSERGNRRIAH